MQSVMVHKMVYVGGGYDWLDSENDYIVMAYNTSSNKWSKLAVYKVCEFAMVAVDGQLVLVGGADGDTKSKALGVWRAKTKEWGYPFPDMALARSGCSAGVHRGWLVVAGGRTAVEVTSSVEVLNTDSKQWYAGPQTPVPWAGMKTAIAGDMLYFMGGMTIHGNTTASSEAVYGIFLPALVLQLNFKNSSFRDIELWEEICGTPVTDSTPVSVKGSLLAVGGCEDSVQPVSTIHLYRPENQDWVKVGDLPTPRCQCSVLMVSEGELFIAGGLDNSVSNTNRVDIALLEKTYSSN